MRGSSVNMAASRDGSATGRGRRKMALIKVKMVVLAPIPSANESIATRAKPRLFASARNP